jgi:hypothetical protein
MTYYIFTVRFGWHELRDQNHQVLDRFSQYAEAMTAMEILNSRKDQY